MWTEGFLRTYSDSITPMAVPKFGNTIDKGPKPVDFTPPRPSLFITFLALPDGVVLYHAEPNYNLQLPLLHQCMSRRVLGALLSQQSRRQPSGR